MYGNEIKINRKASGLTQQEVAKITGIPQNTISWIESDKGIPNIQQCVLLANCFGITIDELIGKESIQEKERQKEITTIFNQTINIK
ncbi:MAG: helix-turn-helix transcriptional regulator [Clostridiales bacterium]|nr:helix-turn-helix transcriptional regulator [Clostridiales bacterium]